jgi:hypothetical protein
VEINREVGVEINQVIWGQIKEDINKVAGVLKEDINKVAGVLKVQTKVDGIMDGNDLLQILNA